MQGYSVADLEKFLDYCSAKGLLKRNTAVGRKTAVSKILGQLDADEQSDVRSIDLADAFDRWQNKQGAGYDPKSLSVYDSRLKSAVQEFLTYKNDPKSYKPGGVTRKSSGSLGRKKRPVAPGQSPQAPKNDQFEQPQSDTDSATVPPLLFSVPIRPGVAAWVRITGLPQDITMAEASSAAMLAKAMVEPLLLATAHKRVPSGAET